jgi:hypothetical protein
MFAEEPECGANARAQSAIRPSVQGWSRQSEAGTLLCTAYSHRSRDDQPACQPATAQGKKLIGSVRRERPRIAKQRVERCVA